MKRSGFTRRDAPAGTCAACGRVKKLTAAGKMPPHHPPNAPGKKCYETAWVNTPPEWRPAKPRARVAAVNPKRKARLRAEQFGAKADWIRTLPCSTCGRPAPSDPSHVRSRGAGGGAVDLVPMCRMCHDGLHAMGRYSFALKNGIELEALARDCEELWQRVESSITPGRAMQQRIGQSESAQSGGMRLDPVKSGVDRHHRDGNVGNNEPENIVILCRRCHMLIDGRLDAFRELGRASSEGRRTSPSPCVVCGRPSKPL